MDEGDVLTIFEEDILPRDTNLSLRERLVKKSAIVLGDVLEKWINGEITPIKQDGSKATYCWQRDISKENAQINWESMNPEYIERLVRAMIPWPVAWTVLTKSSTRSLEGNVAKIFEGEVVEIKEEREPGELFILNNMLLFGTQDKGKALRVKDIQIEGKNRIKERDFLNGLGKNI